MIDCLLLGHYETSFVDYVDRIRQMGVKSCAYRDVNLSFVEIDGAPVHAMGLLNRIRVGTNHSASKAMLHNADFLWPAMVYLGTYLWRRGFSFEIVNLPHLETEKLESLLCSNEIGVVAITTTLQVSAIPIIELVKKVRFHNSTATIVVGGPFIDNMTKTQTASALRALLQYIGADIYVASSEGEKALADILECLRARDPLDRIDNIYYRDGKSFTFTRAVVESNALEANMAEYKLFHRQFNEFVTLRTAKSCPFRCAFCAFPQRAGKYQYLTVQQVENELNAIRDVGGVSTLTFIDDTFNVPKERFRELLRMMIRNNYGFKWNSFFRSDHGDERTMELMAQAGCEGVFLGVESASDEQLRRMNKTSRKKHYLRAIRTFAQLGIRTHANLVVGFPGETDETCQETMAFIADSKPDTFRAQIWYADPITPIFMESEAYNIKGSAYRWQHNTMNAERASHWVYRMFLEIDDSAWLPQDGFELWSTFYLQRKGMSFQDITNYLKLFREIKRSELASGTRAELSLYMDRLTGVAARLH